MYIYFVLRTDVLRYKALLELVFRFRKTDNKTTMKRHSMSSLGVIPATASDIRVEKLEHRTTPKIPFPHKHDFYQLVIILSGQGWHEIDFTRHAVSKNQIFVIKPGQVHGWKLAKNTCGYVIEYTDASFPQNPTLEGNITRRSRALPDMMKISKNKLMSGKFFELMEEEFRHSRLHSQSILQNYLSILVLELLRLSKAKETGLNEQEDLITQFTDLLETRFRHEHSLAYYAKELKTSAKALSAKIQRSLGKPAKEVIQERCFLEAKRLLSYSTLSVSEIGYELGFADPNYFSRFLKQNLKESALQFRQRALKKS